MRLGQYIGEAGKEGVEFWYPDGGRIAEMRRVDDIVPLFMLHCETFGREFWPSWN